MFRASDDATFVTAQTLLADGGLTITEYPPQLWLDVVEAAAVSAIAAGMYGRRAMR